MIEFCITKEELEKALATLNVAGEKGGTASLAIFSLVAVGRRIHDNLAEFGEAVILRSDPVPGNNFGRVSVHELAWLEKGESV